MAKRKSVDRAVLLTMGLPGVAPKRGRPASSSSMTNAERQRKFRREHNVIKASEKMTATIRDLASEFDLTEAQVTAELLRFALCNRNWRQTGFSCSKGVG